MSGKNKTEEEKDLERWKLFYSLSSEVFNREEARYERLEEKASKCLTAFTFLLVIYGFLWGSALKTLMLDTQTFLKGLLSVFSVFLLLLFIFSWLLTFRTFQTRGREVMPLGEDTVKYFKDKERNLRAIYEGLGKTNKKAYENNKRVTDEELNRFKLGYKMIWVSTILLIIFIIMYSTYLWSL
jgi:hypothetical protein